MINWSKFYPRIKGNLNTAIVVILSIIILIWRSMQQAQSFTPLSFNDRLLLSEECFVFGALIGCLLRLTTLKHIEIKCIGIGLILVLVCSYIYSLYRHNLTLIVFPSLFFLPGVFLINLVPVNTNGGKKADK